MRGQRHRPHDVSTVIIDKSGLFRIGLAQALDGTRYKVTASCGRFRDVPNNAFANPECFALIGMHQKIDCVFSNISQLRQQYNTLHIITLADQFDADELLAAFEAGVDSYLLKNDIDPEKLLKTLDLVRSGGAILPQGFTQMLRSRMASKADLEPDKSAGGILLESPSEAASVASPSHPGVHLSPRERMILRLLTRGASNKHIARELAITESTVKVHVKSLLRKLHVQNRTQAAMWAQIHMES